MAVGGIRTLRSSDETRTLAYCIDLAPRGYVVISASRDLPPVVAYSLTSDAGRDLSPGNPLADLLRWDLGLRMDHAASISPEVAARRQADWAALLGEPPAQSEPRLFEQWPPAGSTPTGGWMRDNWTQYAPYNNLCPMDLVHHARSVAGCPSLAMGQILDFHRRFNWPRFDDGDDYYHDYAGNQFWIDDAHASRSFPSWPQLNTYLQTLFNSYFNGQTPSSTSKAALVFACGAAARQVYNANGSGTFGVSQAADAYARFHCETAELLLPSSPDLYTRLSNNMMTAHPAHLAIVDPAWQYGHNLIVDGYNTNNYYHLNFGFGGDYNGWYLLPSGLPLGLTVIEGVIVDIMIDPLLPMDCNGDDRVNLDDFTYFAGCMTGPTPTSGAPGCAPFDGDGDSDIDLRDFATFQAAFGQPEP